ncbi:phage tail tape measure protein [Sphingomonas sp. PR090111-T3T-6A]|uniref:phage tail tape measure protein n=1 Tax=Sphingomonas sp. PR090111-T3T-6A TaxID=685778 RepID=UPI0003628E53|nr:phage tail tape measure protein [Sphingomonas sp. PR090111-T3T-6A]
MADRNLSLLIKFAVLDKALAPFRALRMGARDLGTDVARTKSELAKLTATQSQIGKLKALEQRFSADTAAMAKERAEIDRLKQAIASTDGPTGNMEKALANAEKAADRLQQRLSGTSTQIGTLGGKLERAGVDLADVARSEDRLAHATYEANQRLREQEVRLERAADRQAKFQQTQALGQKMTDAGTAALATGTAVGAPLVASTKSAADFQSRMTDIAQKVNLTREAGTKLGEQLDALGPKVAQTPTALAEGLDDLAGKGLDPRIAIKMLEPIGKAATAYKADVHDLSSSTFAAFDNLKVPIGQTGKVLDIMAVAGKAGAFELKDMAQYFPQLTAQAQALGQKGVAGVADLAAALEVARKGAGTSSEAATNVQNLLAKINSPETIKKFQKFGVDLPAAIKAGIARGESPIEAIAELANKATKGDTAKLGFLFEDQQAQSALRSVIQNLPLYRQIRADALRANGEVERDFAQRMGDANAKAAHLAATTQTLAHALGNALLPTTGAVMDKLAGWADKAAILAQTHPKLTAGIASVSAAGAGLLVTLGGLGLVGGQVVKGWGYLRFAADKLGILRVLPQIFGAVRVAMLFLARGALQAGLMLLANPLVLAFVAIGAAVGVAAYLTVKHWSTIKAAIGSAVAYISGLGTEFKAIGGHLVDGLTGGILSRIAQIKASIMGLGDKVIGWFRAKLGIHSPSRVFAEAGGFLTAGLAQGIDRTAAHPVRAIGRVAGAVATAAVATIAPVQPLVSPAAAARSAQGSPASPGHAMRPIELHYHAAPGDKDPRGDARRLHQELQRLAAADRRSSYRDDD